MHALKKRLVEGKSLMHALKKSLMRPLKKKLGEPKPIWTY
jgi:hypothetical protein